MASEKTIKFQCLQCGSCCQGQFFVDELKIVKKYIPLYLDEIDNLTSLAKELQVNPIIKPDFKFHDELNNQLIIITYAMQIIDKCVFYDSTEKSCRIYDNRPATCQAYPVSAYQEAFQRQISISTTCNGVKKLKKIYSVEFNAESITKIFENELKNARKMEIYWKDIIYSIMRLEYEGKIKIPVKVPVDAVDPRYKDLKTIDLRDLI